ncbi:MAG: MFS transporter [Haloarculaceae archaeon]
MLLVAALAWATLQMGRFVLPPLLPEIRADLGLTLGQTGVVLTVLQAVYATFQYPSGRLSDRLSRATLIVPGLGVLALAFLLVGSATTYPLLVLGTAVLGLGKGLYAIPSRALLSDLFVERRGRALGLFSAGTDLGGLVASVLSVLVIQYATWRTPFFPVAALLGLLAVLFVLWSREPYAIARADLEVAATLRRLLATRRQRWTLVAYALFFFMVNGVINFLPTYLRTAKGLSPTLASTAFALLFVIGLAIKPVSGALSDRFPRRLVSTGGMLLAAGALGVVVLAGSLVALALATAAFAVGYKSQFPVVDAILMDAAPDDNMGGDLGAARALFLGIGSLGPAYVGVVAQVADYTTAFAGLVGCLVVAAGIIARQGR